MTAELTHHQRYLGGESVDATDDEEVAVINPATQQVTQEETVGLAAPVGHPDATRGYELVRRIHAATVSLNGGGGGPHLGGPFGGDKQSGIGAEFGDDGLAEYTQLKTVSRSAGRP
ncbi:MAG: aldehyde dehydrogenase family protein [Acidimicrobiia bacterium]